MAKVIEVPGMGKVEFPDSMSDQEISIAIQRNMQGSVTEPKAISGRQVGSGQFAPIEPKPKAISEPSRGASMATAFMGGIPTDKKAAVNYFAAQRGISPSRYQIIDGDIAYQADDGKFYKEVSGLGATAAYYAPDVMEMAPDVGAGVALAPLSIGGPLGTATAVGGVSAVAAGTNYLRQKIAGKIAGQELDPLQVGLSGLLSGTAELAPVVRKGFQERRLARDIAQVDPQLVSSLRAKSGQYGIPLTPGELTNLSSLLNQQKVIGNVPESSVQMQKFYKEREAKVQSAVDDYLAGLSQVEDAAVAGNRGVAALEVQRQNLLKAREEAVDPIYKSAFASSVPVNTAPVLSQIDNMLKTQPPTGRAAGYLRKIKDLLQKPGIDAEGNQLKELVPEDRLPNLQNAKFEIDSMFKEDTFSSLDKTVQGKLSAIKENLLQQMGKDNPDYIAANREFERLSQPLNEFNERITGVSLMQMSPDNLKNFANRIFANPSPGTIRYAKKQIIAGGGEEAWNAVTRSFLEEQWTLAKKPAKTQQGAKLDTGNTWQNIIIGDPKQMKAMQAALSPEQFKALRDLSEVLEAAGRAKKLGSDTAFNQLVTEEMFKNPPITSVTTGVARAIGGVKLDQPAKALADWAIRKDASVNAEQIAKIITSPDGINRLKELQKMSPTSAKRWAGTAQLLADYGMLESRE
jgi:hypothetical protein